MNTQPQNEKLSGTLGPSLPRLPRPALSKKMESGQDFGFELAQNIPPPPPPEQL